MRRQRPAAGRRIRGRSDGLEEHFLGGGCQAKRERTVAVLRIKPVVSGSECEGGCRLDGFVTGGGNLKEDFVLALQQDFTVVDAAGRVYIAKRPNEILTGEIRRDVRGSRCGSRPIHC